MEVNEMLVTILMLMLLFTVLKAGLRLTWGAAKFVFGLGLFWFCSLLFILIVLLGGFTHMWLPIIIIWVLFGRGFRRS